MKEQYSILCVDDEEYILKGLRMSLEIDGYKVFTALNGEEALQILDKEPIDLIITDQRMPVMDGAALLRQVRKKYPEIITIMLSGYSDFEALVQAVNEGEIFRFLSKPWDDAELKAVIRTALEQERILNIVENLVKQVCQMVELAESVDVNTSEEQKCISIKLGKAGASLPEEVIFKFLNILFDSLGLGQEDKVKVVGGAVSKQQGKIIITIDIGRGVNLKIEVPKITRH